MQDTIEEAKVEEQVQPEVETSILGKVQKFLFLVAVILFGIVTILLAYKYL